jgi:hypothetical protein
MKTAKDECGCRYEVGDRERWIECCQAHEAEWAELHARAAVERPAAMAEFETPRHILVITGCGAARPSGARPRRWRAGQVG